MVVHPAAGHGFSAGGCHAYYYNSYNIYNPYRRTRDNQIMAIMSSPSPDGDIVQLCTCIKWVYALTCRSEERIQEVWHPWKDGVPPCASRIFYVDVWTHTWNNA